MKKGIRSGVLEVPGRTRKLVAFERLGDSNIYALVAAPKSEALNRTALSFLIACLGIAALMTCVVLAKRMGRLTAQLVEARAMAEVALEKKRKMIGRIDETLEAERKRIAGEIHDTLNAEVVQIKFHAQHIDHACAAKKERLDDDIRRHVAEILAVTQRMYGWGRTLVRNLRPESIDVLGVRGAIAQIVESMSALHPSCEFIYQADESVGFTSDQVSMVAYRVVQEALMNTVKHAAATHVAVSLQAVHPERVRIVVMDDGNGFDPNSTSDGYGLASLRERVESVGGEVNMEAKAGHGCRLEVDLPR
jgi:two-component system sensor histidine kinase UhpB